MRTQIPGPHPDRKLAELAARQHGVVARRQLVALGLSPSSIKRRGITGHLVPLHRGVYAVGHARLRREGWWLAAVLAAGPGAALSHRDAAALHCLRSSGGSRIDVSTPADRRATSGPIRIHGRTVLDALDVTTVDGIPVTTVARTLVDLAGVVPRQQLSKAISEPSASTRSTSRASRTSCAACAGGVVRARPSSARSCKSTPRSG